MYSVTLSINPTTYCTRFAITLPLTDDQYLSGDAAQFYYCIEDNFFTHHVDVCTRKDAILDLETYMDDPKSFKVS